MPQNEKPKIDLIFKSTHINKVFFGFEEYNLVEIALWDKKNKELIFVEETAKIDYKNDDFVSTVVSDITERIKQSGIKRILSKPFRKHIYTKMNTMEFKINMIPEDYYSLVVTSTNVRLNEETKVDKLVYIVGNNCPIELLEYLRNNLKTNQEIQIKKSED